MAEQAKFQKMLEVFLMLDYKYGRTISELSDRFDIYQRTVYRYYDTFKQVDFVIENNNGYFRIDKENATAQDISQLLHFTEEEAFILSKTIHAITKKEETKNIYNLIQAIKQQKQVVLKEYKSGNSKNIRDRIVEPIDFVSLPKL